MPWPCFFYDLAHLGGGPDPWSSEVEEGDTSGAPEKGWRRS